MNPSLPKQTRAMIQIAEMYRIYSAIDHALSKSMPASLVITSAERSEGKTAMVVGLSTMCAMKDKRRVLAIDFNWQDPALHTYFGLDLIASEKVLNGHPIKELTQSSGIDNLDILTAVKTNEHDEELPGNMLAKNLIDQARTLYDVIMIDSSKVFPTNRRMIDPVGLSKIANATAMVVLGNVTSRAQVKRAQKVLESGGASIIGVIVNQWKNPLAFA